MASNRATPFTDAEIGQINNKGLGGLYCDARTEVLLRRLLATAGRLLAERETLEALRAVGGETGGGDADTAGRSGT